MVLISATASARWRTLSRYRSDHAVMAMPPIECPARTARSPAPASPRAPHRGRRQDVRGCSRRAAGRRFARGRGGRTRSPGSRWPGRRSGRPTPERAGDAVREHDRIAVVGPEDLGVQPRCRPPARTVRLRLGGSGSGNRSKSRPVTRPATDAEHASPLPPRTRPRCRFLVVASLTPAPWRNQPIRPNSRDEFQDERPIKVASTRVGM